MRLTIKLLITVFAIVVTGVAESDEGRWYVGYGIGNVRSGYGVADFDDGSISRARLDNSDSAWKVFAGFFVSRHFAVEAGFIDLHNDYDLTRTFTANSDGTGPRFVSFPDGLVSVDFTNITGPFVAASAYMPLTPKFRIGAKAGIVSWRARRKTIDLEARSDWLNDTDALVGVVMAYRFGDHVAVRAEAERYFDVGQTDQDVVSVSILLRF